MEAYFLDSAGKKKVASSGKPASSSSDESRTEVASEGSALARTLLLGSGILLAVIVLWAWAKGGNELNTAEAYVQRSIELSIGGEINERVALLEKGIEAYPQSQEIRSQLLDAYLISARAKLRSGNFKRAEEVLGKASSEYPDNSNIQSLVDQLQLRRSLDETAETPPGTEDETAETPPSTEKEKQESVFSRAESLVAKGKKEKAIKLLKESFNRDPDSFKEGIAANPDNAKFRAIYGTFLNRANQQDEAIAQLEKAVDLEPNYADAHLKLGAAYLQRKQHDKAATHLSRATELGRNNPDAHDLLGYAYLKLNQHTDAIESLQKAVQGDSEDPGVNARLGRAYAAMDQYAEALPHLEKGIVESSNWRRFFQLGNAYAQVGQIDSAIGAFKRAVRKQPEKGRIRYTLGLAHRASGRHDRAAVSFERALRHLSQGEKFEEVCHDLRDAYEKSGQVNRSRIFREDCE